MTAKIIYLAMRNPNIAEADFAETWISHARLGSTMKSSFGGYFLRLRYAIKVYGADVPPEYVSKYDGAGILRMRSWDDLHKARSNPDMVTTMKKDELRVFSMEGVKFSLTGEETMHMEKRDNGGAALVIFVARRADVPAEKFDAYWNDTYVPAVRNLPIIKETAATFATTKVNYVPGPDYDFAAITEIWFDDIPHAIAAAWDKDHRQVMQDLNAVADAGRGVSLVTRLNFEKTPGNGY